MMTTTGTRRILALWFPYLSTDRLARAEKGRQWRAQGIKEVPRVFTATVKNAQRITAMNEAAEALSLTIGQTLADARAVHPHLDVVDEDAGADATLLENIADWADRYTPLVALDRSASFYKHDGIVPRIFRHGLYLDITGCAHLFQADAKAGDSAEAALLRDIKMRLFEQGLCVHAGLASTVGAAWAVSRFSTCDLIARGNEKGVLSPLPLSALRLDPKIVAAMERVGLKRIEQILSMPRAPLAARFGLDLITRLMMAFGEQDESISPRLPPPDLMAERRFHEPISQHDDVEAAIASLSETLSLTLESRGEGARALEASLFHTDGSVTRAAIATARPLRAPDQIKRLFRDKLDETLTRFQARMAEAATGFDIIRLCVLEADCDEVDQIGFMASADGDGSHGLSADLAHLIDKLGIRLGASNVRRLHMGDTHQPERAHVGVSAAEEADGTPPSWEELQPDHPIDRPIRLFRKPEEVDAIAAIPEGPPLRFRWRRVLHDVARVEGPERIAAHWWVQIGQRDKGQGDGASPSDLMPFTRDYYRVEDVDGRRFWLYRNGLYDFETAEPGWYMHGLFA
ncbi:MAG: DNA polymerase Y family protein [Pseudomonadota bacterium]